MAKQAAGRLAGGPWLSAGCAGPVGESLAGVATLGEDVEARGRDTTGPCERLREPLGRVVVERPGRVHQLDEGEMQDLGPEGAVAAPAGAGEVLRRKRGEPGEKLLSRACEPSLDAAPVLWNQSGAIDSDQRLGILCGFDAPDGGQGNTASEATGCPPYLTLQAGGMFRFCRQRFCGSYRRLTSTRRG